MHCCSLLTHSQNLANPFNDQNSAAALLAMAGNNPSQKSNPHTNLSQQIASLQSPGHAAIPNSPLQFQLQVRGCTFRRFPCLVCVQSVLVKFVFAIITEICLISIFNTKGQQTQPSSIQVSYWSALTVCMSERVPTQTRKDSLHDFWAQFSVLVVGFRLTYRRPCSCPHLSGKLHATR